MRRELRFVAGRIFGDPSRRKLIRGLDGLCRAGLGSGLAEVSFVHVSGNGATFGLVLGDRRAVVVKAHAQPARAGRLAAIHRVQESLSARGFPCPRPLLEPQPFGRGLATCEALDDAGEHQDPRHPSAREAIAGGLAELVGISRTSDWAREIDLSALPRFEGEELWDWSSPPPGAASNLDPGLDEIALEARRRATGGEPIVGHFEWSAKHLRLAAGRVTAAYDWNALGLATEPQLVGATSAIYTISVPALGGLRAASPTESRGFPDRLLPRPRPGTLGCGDPEDASRRDLLACPRRAPRARLGCAAGPGLRGAARGPAGRHRLAGRSGRRSYSHSIVAGGFDEMSRATRFTPGTSLMIRFETRSSRS